MTYSTKFRGPTGQRYTKALFYETAEDRSTALYTLKDRHWEANGVSYPSLFLLYLEERDPTEYNFAMKYFESYDHWLQIADAPFLRDLLPRWRRDLETLIRAEALEVLRKDAASGSRSATASAKFLVERGWAPKQEKGRPTKAQIQQAADNLAKTTTQIDDDYERVLGVLN